jgi:hypothetical protein
MYLRVSQLEKLTKTDLLAMCRHNAARVPQILF